MELTHQQLAELMAGVARSHAAIINAIFDKATVNKKISPALQREAQLTGDPINGTEHHPYTLDNLYSRMLLISLKGYRPGAPDLRDFFAPALEQLIPKA